MGTMRFNHMELTFPEGALDAETREGIRGFYGEVFGWGALDVPLLGQQTLLLQVDAETSQFILLAESPKPIQSPGYDHLGILLETRAEVDAVLEKCRKWQERDERVRVKEYDDLVQGPLTVHAFYVKHLLPIWLDVQCMEYEEGAAPERRWHYD